MPGSSKGDFRRHWLERRLSSALGKVFSTNIDILSNAVFNRLIKENIYTRLSPLPINYSFPEFAEKTSSETREKVREFFKRLIKLGLREALENPRAIISDNEVNREYESFIGRSRALSWVSYLLETFKEDYAIFLIEMTNLLGTDKEAVDKLTIKGIRDYLIARVTARFNRYYSSMSVEMQAGINSARESKYRTRDPEKKFKYHWGIRTDQRTTPQCLEIARRVNKRMAETGEVGVELDWLKAIINQVAVEIDPKWSIREWVPHYNCRSVLKRVVI